MKLPVAGAEKTIVDKFGKRVFEQTFTLPDGASTDYVLFEQSVKGIAPAIVLPVTRDMHVVAIRQFRYGVKEVVLELPGGCQRVGQTLEEVVCDELGEETGYVPGKLIKLSRKTWFEPASMRIFYASFLALDCVFEKAPRPGRDEFIEVVRIPVGEWISLVESGKIEDGKSIVVTALARKHLSQMGI